MKAEKGVAGGLEITEGPVGLDDETGPLVATQLKLRDSMHGLAKVERALSDREQEHSDEMRKLLLEIIKVEDDFERLFRAVRDKGDRLDPSTKNLIDNFQSISRVLRGVLRRQGVMEMKTVDQSFDSCCHKVSELVQDPELPDGTIVGQDRKGYVWRNLFLRKAEVVVVRNDKEEHAAGTRVTGSAS